MVALRSPRVVAELAERAEDRHPVPALRDLIDGKLARIDFRSVGERPLKRCPVFPHIKSYGALVNSELALNPARAALVSVPDDVCGFWPT